MPDGPMIGYGADASYGFDPCPNCGVPLQATASFCQQCGQPITRGGVGTQPPTQHLGWLWIAIPAVVLLTAGSVAAGVVLHRGPAPASAAQPSRPSVTLTSVAGPEPTVKGRASTPAEQPEIFGSLTGYAAATAPSTSANSVDGSGRRTTYGAGNLLDRDPSTAWRTDGNAAGETLRFTLDASRPVTTLGLVNGFDKIDDATGEDRYWQERRLLRVTWTVGGKTFEQVLDDGNRGVQSITFAPVRTSVVTLRIDRVTRPQSKRFDRTVISDVVIANH